MTDGSIGHENDRGSTYRRSVVEFHLDRLIRENRFTIAVVFPLMGAVILISSAMELLPPLLRFNPWLIFVGVLVMRSPLIGGILPLVDRRAFVGLSILATYTFMIEYIGIHTGWPYGTFEYGVDLGPMVEGVPVALPILFIPLVINGYLLCLQLLGERSSRTVFRVAAVVPTVILIDVILDPGAIALEFWVYESDGVFYGVPLSNYRGWLLAAIVGVIALEFGFDSKELIDRVNNCSYILDDFVSFVILWGIINLWAGHTVPVVISVLFGVALVYVESEYEPSSHIRSNR